MGMTVNGLDQLRADFASWASIPDDAILDRVVLPAAEYFKTRLAMAAATFFNVVSGSLAGSIKILRRGVYDWGIAATVGPDQGKHPHATQGKRKPRAQGGGGGHYGGTNAEIAYILEYGSTRIPARHWIEQTLNEVEPDIHAMMEAAFAELMDELSQAA